MYIISILHLVCNKEYTLYNIQYTSVDDVALYLLLLVYNPIVLKFATRRKCIWA